MDDKKKTKAQLIAELEELRKQLTDNHTQQTNSEHNITEIKRPDQKLKEHEVNFSLPEFYPLIVEMAFDGVWLLDKKFLTVYVNPAIEKMLGYAKEEMIGRSWYDFGDAEWVARAKELEKRRESGINEPHLFLFIHNNGKKVMTRIATTPIYDTDGNFNGALGILSDITRQQEGEEALKVKNLLNDIADSSGFGMSILNSDYTIAWYNNLQAQWFCELEKTMGRNCFEVFHGRDELCQGCPAQKTFEKGEVVSYERTGITTSSGADRTFLFTSSPIYDVNNNIEQIVLITQDITERRKAEEKITEERNKLDSIIGAMTTSLTIRDRDYNITFQSPLVVNNFGDRIGEKCYRTYEGKDEICDGCPAELSFKDGISHTSVREVIMPDGRNAIWENISNPIIESDGEINFCIEISSDITDRKRAEEQLNKSHSLLENLARLVPGVIYQYRLNPDGSSAFPYSSPGMNDIYEYSPEDVREDATPVFGRLHPEDIEMVSERIFESARTLKTLYCEYRVILPRQGLRWRWSHAQPERTADGGTLWYGTIQDITEHKLAEQAQFESEERHSRLFDSMTQGVVYHAANDKIISANHAAQRILGLSLDQLRGKTSMDPRWQAIRTDGSALSGQDHPSKVAFRTGKTVNNFIMGVMKPEENRYTWISVSAIPFFMQGQTTPYEVYAIFNDITERRRAEQDYRILFQEMLGGFALHEIICDDSGNPSDYRFLAINPAFERMTGLKAQDVIGKTVLEVMPGTEDSFIETFSNVALTGEPVFFDNYSDVLHKHFEIRAFRPAPNQFACIFLDVTERKEAEAEHERLITAIEQSGEIIIVTDTEGNIQYVNPIFEKITGYTNDEVLGQNPRILKSGKQNEEFYRLLWDTITTGRTWHGQFENKRKDGTSYTEDATISPVYDTQGKIVNYVAVKRDISGQLRLESQFQQAQKMEAVGRLAGGVAHDFNNMLSVISGNAELALSNLKSFDPLYAEITEIQNAAERSADLTRQLLAFARKQTVAPKVLDLNEIIKSILKMIQRLIGENISLSWNPGNDIWKIKIDPSQIDQILANLCVNARDAITDVGKVTVETANVVFNEAYCADHAGYTPGEYVMLAVSDNGCGMDKEMQSKLFEPFFTTKKMGEGTGLGLSTVFGIVKQNNGFVNVYSEPGEGTTFKIYIPRYVGTATPAVLKGPAKVIAGGPETILLVEDEPALLKLSTTMLERLGYTVLAAKTPKEAISLANECSRQIHLLMTDVVLPGMNGRDLANILFSSYPTINTLFMSGYTSNVIAHHGVLDEGVNFIQKPFSMKDMAAKVREALE